MMSTVCFYLHDEVPRVVKPTKIESRMVIPRDWRREEWEFNGYRSLVLQDRKSSGDWLYNVMNVLNTD